MFCFSVVHWWTFELFPLFGCCAQCHCWCTSISVSVLSCFRYGVELLGHVAVLCLTFWRAWFFRIPVSFLLLPVLSIFAILGSVRWCLVVLIAVSLMNSDVDRLFMSLCGHGVFEAAPGQRACTWLWVSGPGVGSPHTSPAHAVLLVWNPLHGPCHLANHYSLFKTKLKPTPSRKSSLISQARWGSLPCTP